MLTVKDTRTNSPDDDSGNAIEQMTMKPPLSLQFPMQMGPAAREGTPKPPRKLHPARRP
jgi:hypothetical protein